MVLQRHILLLRFCLKHILWCIFPPLRLPQQNSASIGCCSSPLCQVLEPIGAFKSKGFGCLAGAPITCSPLRHRPPGSVLIGQDVEDLLLQLVGGHVISVLGRANEVVAHLLLLSPVGSVLGAVGLWDGVSQGFFFVKIQLNISSILHFFDIVSNMQKEIRLWFCSALVPQIQHVCAHPQPAAGSGWTLLRWQLAQYDPSWHGTEVWEASECATWC